LYYKLAVSSYVGLVCLLITWYGFISPPQRTLSTIFTVMFIGILLLPAKDLYQKNSRVYMWSSYLILIYFSHAIIESWANDEERIYAIAELILSCIYFLAATFCYRESRKGNS